MKGSRNIEYFAYGWIKRYKEDGVTKYKKFMWSADETTLFEVPQ